VATDDSRSKSRDTLKLRYWSAGKLASVAALIVVGALVTTAGLDALVLDKTYRVDEERGSVFVSYERHPECGAVYEFVTLDDLEAGAVASGDPSACEYRNLLFSVLQVLVVMAAIGSLLWMLWARLAAGEGNAKTPGPSGNRAS
jgi:H+/Cl- antiporter ClcA